MAQNRRLKLQMILEELLGSRNVYFEPPPSFKMAYPCIVYRRSRMNTEYAENKPYTVTDGYQLTVIDKNPDSEIPQKVRLMPYCSFVQHYTSDNLNHDVFNIYF